jgi:hypothetical protein
MNHVSLERTVVWVYTSKLDIAAEIVPSIDAEEAFTTGNAGFHRDAVTWLQIGDTFTDFEDDTSSFMTKDAVTIEDQGTDFTVLPEMNV